MSRASAFFALAAALSSSCASAAVTFTAAVDAAATPMQRTIVDSFGSSHGSTTLRAKWREHFTTTVQEIPFKRVRFHGILDDDMSTFLNKKANGALVFDTLDFLVASGIAPTIELGFMPEDLAINTSVTVFHYKGGASTFADRTAWMNFITDFVSLLVTRYSLPVVQTWRFEVWNEPNCGFFNVTNCCGPTCGNQPAYFELYDATARAVKAADASLLVGGPATAMLAWIPEFLAATAAAGSPVDFVSSHLYPTDPFLNATRDAFMDAIAAASIEAGGVPFFLTEFNAGLGSREGAPPLLDSSYAAAFVVHNHLAVQAHANVKSLSWWTYTDFGFEEQGADPLPWHPSSTKFGAQTMYGVRKPVWRGFEMLADASVADVVPVTAAGTPDAAPYKNAAGTVIGATAGLVDVLVGMAAGGTVTALLTNFNAAGVAPLPNTTTVTVTFTGLNAPLPTAATLELIDSTHANPYAAWVAAGSPLYPDAAEIAAETSASALVAAPLALTPAGADAVTATVTLEPWAVGRVRFTAA